MSVRGRNECSNSCIRGRFCLGRFDNKVVNEIKGSFIV